MRVIIRDGDEITVADTNSIDDPKYIVIGKTGGSGKAHTFNVPTVTGSYTYSGSAQSPTLLEYYSDFMTLSGDVVETNAGTYQITVSLKDIANCQWSDMSVGDKTLTWSIGKAALPKPTISPSSLVLSELSPTATFSVTRSGNGAITATSSDPEKVSASVSGTTVTVTALDTSDDLEATVTVTVGEGDNYLAYTATDVVCAVRIALPAIEGTVRLHGTGLSCAIISPFNGTLEYSYDGAVWNTYTVGMMTATGSDIFLRGTNITHFNTYSSHPSITLSGSNISISGKIESLLDYTTVLNGGHPTADSYAFYEFFKNCSNIVNAADFELPSSQLSDHEFYQCFYLCRGLINAPSLPSTNLGTFCYYGMFVGCSSLINAPALPATTLVNSCYDSMFQGCTSLVSAPALPATSGRISYSYMFYGCTSLTAAPALPAVLDGYNVNTLNYSYMFSGCSSLVNAPALPSLKVEYHSYLYMFQGCTSLVNAPALPATTLGNGCYKRMFADCVNLESIAAITASDFPSDCLTSMYNGCVKIKISETQVGDYANEFRLPASGSATAGTNPGPFGNMFDGTGGTFTGTPSINTTYYTSNTVIS